MSAEMPEINVDANNLYREENYSDLKVASIRHMIPIKVDGSEDDSRKSFFMAQTNIMSSMGPMPVNARLESDNLADALKEFPEAVKKAIQDLVEEAKEYQRREANKIVVPGAQPTSKIIQ